MFKIKGNIYMQKINKQKKYYINKAKETKERRFLKNEKTKSKKRRIKRQSE